MSSSEFLSPLGALKGGFMSNSTQFTETMRFSDFFCYKTKDLGYLKNDLLPTGVSLEKQNL